MSETVIPVSEEWKKRAHIGPDQYEKLYRRSLDDPERLLG